MHATKFSSVRVMLMAYWTGKLFIIHLPMPDS